MKINLYWKGGAVQTICIFLTLFTSSVDLLKLYYSILLCWAFNNIADTVFALRGCVFYYQPSSLHSCLCSGYKKASEVWINGMIIIFLSGRPSWRWWVFVMTAGSFQLPPGGELLYHIWRVPLTWFMKKNVRIIIW